MNSYKKLIGAVSLIAFASIASAATIKLGHVDGADWQTSKKGAAGVIFKNIVEGETTNKVELFPAKALGNEGDLVQLIKQKFLENYPLWSI